jgi:hypothetical protein
MLASAPVVAPSPGPCDPDAPFRLGVVDRVATVTAPEVVGRPFSRRHDVTEVRVRLRFVVGCDGLAEPASFALVSTDDSAYVLGAVALVQASRFTAATVDGRPVRQIVERSVVWHHPRRADAVEFVCPPQATAGAPRALRSEDAASRPEQAGAAGSRRVVAS